MPDNWNIIDPRTVGSEIRRTRLARGLTVEVASGLAGINRTHLTKIEHGHRKPTLETFCRIAYALQISPSDLLKRIQSH